MSPDIKAVEAYLTGLQQHIIQTLEHFDGGNFHQDAWIRPDGGGGDTRVIEDSAFFERGGVNFSHVSGPSMPASATAHRPNLAGRQFEALGISLVLHPRNPYCPTAHMNVRLFVANAPDAAPVWWFGGGLDLTPYYPFDDDIRHFHATCKAAVLPFGGEEEYRRLKEWCDRYFYLRHRDEARGVGGLFFDDLGADGTHTFGQAFALTRSIGDAFLDAYLPILERRRKHAYGERERDFQAYRRGRYVEFNLVHDRGTLFGLQSGGRIESILMSLPPVARWRYDWHAEPDSPEARLTSHYLQPRDWA